MTFLPALENIGRQYHMGAEEKKHMGGTIFLVGDHGELVEMNEEEYDSEDRLQKLLAEYPRLLAGDQMDSEKPPRWILVTREAGVPSEEGGSDRWSVDHLFLDQEGIPTLVEVKRSTDTRIRREVVGQMLDYAANSVVYWPVEEIRARFITQWGANGADPDEKLTDFLGADADVEEFWDRVATNLKAGKVRLVFLADKIPSELRRIVEFLGSQMNPAEVFAVEVKQFLSKDGRQTLVPRVVGNTATAERRRPPPGSQWDEAKFFEELEAQNPEFINPGRKIYAWASDKALQISWGKGRQTGSFTPLLSHGGLVHRIFSVWTSGHIQWNFRDLKERPPFDRPEMHLELLRRINDIAGVTISEEKATKFPSFLLSDVRDEANTQVLLNALDWAVAEIQKT